jgi:TonB family protein
MKARYLFPAVAVFSLCMSLCVVSASAQQPEPSHPPYMVSQKVADEMLLSKVAPEYPDAVKNANTSGQIVIMFTIDRDGRVAEAMAVPKDFSGRESRNIDDPKLRRAAVEAVKQWRYRPYLYNGDSVEVETSVVLPFDFRKTGASSQLDPGTARYGEFGGLLLARELVEEKLINRVEPQYPQMAKIARIQGDVWLHVLIDKQGHVAKIKAVQGHPILVQSGLDAVKQWEYQPFLLNAAPVEVESTVVVKFHM